LSDEKDAGTVLQIEQLRVALLECESVLDLLRYLVEVKKVRGIRSRLADAARCQPSYLSQVLGGTASLSTEQLHGIAKMLGLDELEWEYVRELGLLDRAGTEELKEDGRKRLVRIRAQARASRETVPADEAARGSLSGDDLLWYVANWQVSAILAAVVAPRFRTVSALAQLLRLPPARIQEVTQKLLDRGMLRQEKNELISNLPPRLFLGSEAAGSTFRSAWIQHGIERATTGYREGYQKGGVFRASAEEFEALKAEVTALHRTFFSAQRDPTRAERVGFFGIDLFEV